MKKYFALVFLLISFDLLSQDEPPYVLLISFDGFRHDYVELYDTPNFDVFIRNGTAAEGLIPCFPSKTFPNHYTLVTGMYPANHGLVGNSFYDRDRKVTYAASDRDLVEDGYFYGGMPLWQLVQKAGYRSASYFWVGSEAEIAGSYPDYYYRYNEKVSNENRIKQLGKWLNLKDEKRPRFITLNFSLVDSQGHNTGPKSVETWDAVKEADRLLGLIMQTVDASRLPVNIIITSDHGMFQARNREQSFIRLDELIDLDATGMEVVTGDTYVQFYFANEADIQPFYTKLSFAGKGFRVYLKKDTPDHWKYKSNDRIGDIIAVAPLDKVFATRERYSLSESPYFGVHGYDPRLTSDMNGIFYANGPNIRQRLIIAPFQNIHVYPLIATILGLEIPEGVDGDPKVLESILVRE